MTNNGQRVRFAEIRNWVGGEFRADGIVIFSGLCPHCAGEGCMSDRCWSGEMMVSDLDERFAETFSLNLRYVNFETALRLGKELATAARLKLEAQGVTGWEK